MGEHQRPSTMKGLYSCSCLLLVLLTVNCSPAGQARSDEDAWLAVINSGGSTQAQEPDPQASQDTELYQFEKPEGLGGQQPAGRVEQQASERAAQQPIDIVPQPYGIVPQQQEQQPLERFAQQPVAQQVPQQQQPQQFQPQVSQQQRVPVPQQRVPPQQQRRPPPQQRAPVQRLPPQQRLPQNAPIRPGRPGPPRPGQGRPGFPGNRRKPTKPGLISGAIGAIGDGIGGAVKGAQCAASNFITDEKLKDEKFIRFQMDCALDLVQCDDIGKKIKILAPEVLAGRCPPPCNECTRKQIRKVMTELSQRYPGRFQEMIGKLRG